MKRNHQAINAAALIWDAYTDEQRNEFFENPTAASDELILIALMWNDPNGEYDELPREQLIYLVGYMRGQDETGDELRHAGVDTDFSPKSRDFTVTLRRVTIEHGKVFVVERSAALARKTAIGVATERAADIDWQPCSCTIDTEATAVVEGIAS